MVSRIPIITTKSVRSSLIRCIFDWSPLVFWLHLFVLHWCSLFCWFVLFLCLFFFTCLLSMKDLCHCLNYPSFLLDFFFLQITGWYTIVFNTNYTTSQERRKIPNQWWITQKKWNLQDSRILIPLRKGVIRFVENSWD